MGRRLADCKMQRLLLLYIAFVIPVESYTSQREMSEATLSPASWPKDEFDRLELFNLQKTLTRPKPLAYSSGEGVVAGTTNAFAVHAGLDALRKGGNAMDACLATAITEVTLAAGSYVSYAGVTNILYYDKKSDKLYSVDGGWNIPHEKPADIPQVHTDGPNGASVLIPGFFAGVSEAAKRFSKFPLSTLIEPALYFAEKGFKVPWWMSGSIYVNYNSKTLLRTPEGRAIFTNPKTGRAYTYGELFQQHKLAEFLRNMSSQGKEYFYKGSFAESFAETVLSQKGTISKQDMADYEATWNEPSSTTYNNHQIYSSGSEWGGAELVQKLNLMELAGLSGTSDSYLTNSTKLFWLASIARLSFFASWYNIIGINGPERLREAFGVSFDKADRQTKENAETLWNMIGTPDKMATANKNIKKLLGGSSKRDGTTEEYYGSDGVVAFDSEGNACAMAHTINSQMWGTGLFTQGIALPHSAAIFKSFVKATKPGARLASGLQPVLAMKTRDNERKPVLAVSVIGQSYAMATPLLITNVIDSHMTPTQALGSPMFLLPSSDSYYQDVRIEEFLLDNHVKNKAESMGQDITEVPYKVSNGAMGLGVVATSDDRGNMYAGTNPDRWGYAEGVNYHFSHSIHL